MDAVHLYGVWRSQMCWVISEKGPSCRVSRVLWIFKRQRNFTAVAVFTEERKQTKYKMTFSSHALSLRLFCIFKFLLMKWFIYAADDVYHSLFAETFNFPSCFSFIWLCTAWGHKLSVRGRIEIICHFPSRGRMCNLAVLLTSMISLRQGVLEVKYLGTGDAKQCLWVCY